MAGRARGATLEDRDRDGRIDALLLAAASRPDADGARALAAARRRLLGAAAPTGFGRYVVGAPIGTGGMGRVLAARDEVLDREVAIKLLKSGLPAATLRAEAHALARLSHPNIVAVFDLGPTGVPDELFVVMEWVRGPTLRAWLGAARRSADEVIEIFVGVGEGIAAAHRAGIVHGDVKPDNVIVAGDGTPKVLDFGLARLATSDTTGEEERRGADVHAVAEGGATQRARGGTPRYMAPEVAAGRPADALADQYSFCVALREALGGRVPAPWRRTIRRGLAESPTRRWPSMPALLDALAHSRRGWHVPVAFASLVLAAGALLAWSHERSTACDAQAPSWTAARRTALQHGFVAMARPYALGLGRHVDARLELRAVELATARTAACGARDEARLACIDSIDAELGAAVDALIAGGPPLLERAAGTIARLADPRDCSAGAPVIPAVVRSGWRTELAQATTELNAGAPERALTIVRRVHGDAMGFGAERVAAEARWLEGAALSLAGDEGAGAVLIAAIEEAASAGADAIELSATTDLVSFLQARARFEEAEQWVRHGLTIADRMPASDGPRAKLIVQQAHVDLVRGRHDLAEQRYAEALGLLRAEVGGEHPEVALALTGLGTVALKRGDSETARSHYCEAERILDGTFGHDSPRTIEIGINCAIGSIEREPEVARERLRELVMVAERSWGENDTRVGNALGNLGSVEVQLGAAADAVAHLERADAISLATLGATHPNRIAVLINLGLALVDVPDAPRAESIFLQSIALAESGLGPDHPLLAEAWTGLARARLALGRHASAIEAATRGLVLHERVGDDPARVAEGKSVLAQALVAGGEDPVRAEGLLDAALIAFGDRPALHAERRRARAALAALREAHAAAGTAPPSERASDR